MPPKVLGYTRVSTEDQAEHGVSLAAQAERVRAHARALGLDLVELIEDAGVSARSLDRPGLGGALARLDRGEASGLVVAKLDRLTRSVRDWSALVDDRMRPPHGWRLYSASESIELATASGRMVANILMSVAQCERETVVERTATAMSHKSSLGERLGTIPYGKQLGEDGRTLAPCPSELATADVCRALRAERYTFRAIASRLDELGIPTRSGRPWGKSSVAEILARGEFPSQPPEADRP